jgi:hypothetical protein
MRYLKTAPHLTGLHRPHFLRRPRDEVSIMRHHRSSAVKRAQRFLESNAGMNIQMVDRFIEQQKVAPCATSNASINRARSK